MNTDVIQYPVDQCHSMGYYGGGGGRGYYGGRGQEEEGVAAGRRCVGCAA